jgi:hypothetical protein
MSHKEYCNNIAEKGCDFSSSAKAKCGNTDPEFSDGTCMYFQTDMTNECIDIAGNNDIENLNSGEKYGQKSRCFYPSDLR